MAIQHTPAPTSARGIYGFVFYLLFSTMFIFYVFWTFVPLTILEDTLGLTYLPDKYFAVIVPILVLVCVTLFAFLIYPSLGLIMTLDVDDPTTIRDRFSIRRCQHREETVCENKLENDYGEDEIFCRDHRDKGDWITTTHVQQHQYSRRGIKSPAKTQIKGNLISHYCDCRDGSEGCLLRDTNLPPQSSNKNCEDYFSLLAKRKRVPSVVDINISDICKKLYLNE